MTETSNVNPRVLRIKLVMLIALAIVVGGLVASHNELINGPWYWSWSWRDAAASPRWWWYGWMLLAAAPAIGAIALEPIARSRVARAVVLALLMIGVLAMKLMIGSVLTRPLSFDVLDYAVQHPQITSYYTDAAALAQRDDWLAIYPAAMPLLNLHTQSKPPGAVAYSRAFIRALGHGRQSAVPAGIVLIALATLSIPAVAWLVRELTGDSNVAMCAAVMMALCPGFVVITPTFDAVWPIVTCAMIVFWRRAVLRESARYAAAFGATFALACFASYSLLVLGGFLGAWTVLAKPQRPDDARSRFVSITRLVAIALATTAILYLALFLATAFDPIATFASAWRNQHALLAQHRDERPYPWTILFDLTDFALGAGWLAIALAAMATARWTKPRGDAIAPAARDQRLVMWLCVGLPVLVAALGLIQSETARCWNFMLPLLLVPAALELSTWSSRARLTVYTCTLTILLLIGRHMRFMGP